MQGMQPPRQATLNWAFDIMIADRVNLLIISSSKATVARKRSGIVLSSDINNHSWQNGREKPMNYSTQFTSS